MRFPFSRILGIMMAILASGCGAAGDGSTAAPAPSTSVTAPSPDDIPRSDLKDPRPIDWSSAEVVSENQIRVHYTAGDPKCVGIDAKVEEDQAMIRVTILQGTVPGAPEMCPAVARFGTVLLTLSSPVAGREITHG